MEKFLIELKNQKEKIEVIADKIESEECYMEEMKEYLPQLNQSITALFEMIQDPTLQINQNFVLQVWNDILYGIEHEDSVFLEDVLRYGLIEIYDYIGAEMQRGD